MSWTIKHTASGGQMTEAEMQGNADEIAKYFIAQGWTKNAIAGMLGNLTVESLLNPDQYEIGYNYSLDYGYGLAQWTPATKYINWATQNGYEQNDPDGQMLWLNTMPNGEWFKSTSNYLPFAEFKLSTADPAYLARVFSDSFERPANYDTNKSTYATNWYKYISGKSYKKKFPIYFYLKHR